MMEGIYLIYIEHDAFSCTADLGNIINSTVAYSKTLRVGQRRFSVPGQHGTRNDRLSFLKKVFVQKKDIVKTDHHGAQLFVW
jgi:hypothetical protein